MQTHLTVTAIPFNFSKEDLEDIKNKLTALSHQGDFSFFDSIKYHKHIENFIFNPLNSSSKNEDPSAFLTIYKLKNQIVNRIESLNYNSQNDDLKIDENHNLAFTDKNFIILNEFAEIGYFVFGFEITSSTNKGIVDFADCVFFRFINDKDQKYKLKIYPKRREYQHVSTTSDGITFEFMGSKEKIFFHNESDPIEIKLERRNNRPLYLAKENNQFLILKKENNIILDRWKIITRGGITSYQNIEINSFNIYELINKGLYSSLDNLIQFDIEKPILLHLFNNTNREQISDDKDLDVLLYRAIRIKSNLDSHSITNLNLVTRTYSGISFCTLMEGAAIMDLSRETSHSDLFNRFFPSFLLAINQREAMIRLNEKLSNFSYKNLENAINDEANNKVIENIKSIKNEVRFFKFKQIIYSVSFYDEIALFYKKLHAAFDIQLLLDDNEASVKEIHDMLVQVENNKEEKLRKEREKKENLQSTLLGAIGCLGLFSFFKDLIPFLNDKQYMILNDKQYMIFYKIISVATPILIMLFIFSSLYNYKKK